MSSKPSVLSRLRGIGGAFRYRSSITGRFIKKAYALKHPRTTEKERIK